MLVLSRKETQRIRLGDDIVITVVRIGGDKVRLGIDAPRDMLVLRDELEPLAGAAGAGVSGAGASGAGVSGDGVSGGAPGVVEAPAVAAQVA